MLYPDRLQRFARRLEPAAAALDTDQNLAKTHWEAFVAEDLHAAVLSGSDFRDALATLAEFSGTFAFLALQQFVANVDLAGCVDSAAPWPSVGVAFGHLRNPAGPAPIWNGRQVDGPVAWLTGAGIFPEVILGVRGGDGSERYARVAASHRAEFCHSAPLALAAATGTGTVSVSVVGLEIEADAFFRVDPTGTKARVDADGVLYQTPLLVGCIRAARRLIHDRGRDTPTTDALLAEVAAAFAAPTPALGRVLRARLGDHAVRLARLACLACGGASLTLAHPAQRLYREALLYNLMAQTPAIVDDAFEEVFP